MHWTKRGIFLGTAAVILAIALEAPGCRSATQVTLSVNLAGARCQEINGTAITVGVEPMETESRVKEQFVSATTNDCAADSGRIGTLVVTPNDEGNTGSVIVVVAFGQTQDPASCTPPAYTNCIVARRRFTFEEHANLELPITIDPDCVNVPCDAFSTCRSGRCFSSDTSCTTDGCTEPGATADGGTSEDGAVDVKPAGVAYCESNETLHCYEGDTDVACRAPRACCSENGRATCGGIVCGIASVRYCCTDDDCGPAGRCMHVNAPQMVAAADASVTFDTGGEVPEEDAGTKSDAGSNTDGGSIPGTDGGTGGGRGIGICVR